MKNKCGHSDCFTCPYPDCILDQMTESEYVEANRRDKEYSEPKPLSEYKQRSFDCTGRKEYFRKHYQENRERKLQVSKEWRKRTNYKNLKDRREEYKQYYLAHKEEKNVKARERNRKVREALNAT
jgi:hypothetical protein